jgi:xylulokinase
MAAVGYEVFKDVEEACSKLIKVSDSVYPIEENKDKYNEVYKIYRNLYYTLKDTFKDVSGIE